MSRLTVPIAMKNVLTRGVFVAALTALVGFQVTQVAAQGQQFWSIVVHFQYPDGFEFDYTLERGVSTENLPAALADCGGSHRIGSVVQYHCYPVPE